MLECLILRLQDVVEEKLTRACGTDWGGVKLCGDNDVAEAARPSAARAPMSTLDPWNALLQGRWARTSQSSEMARIHRELGKNGRGWRNRA